MTRDAYIALLDMVNTPVVLLTHSQGGAFGWLVADARPNLVKAIMTLEPAAPPIRGVDQAKLTYNPGGGLSWGVANSPITYEPAISDPKELQTVLETHGAGLRQGAVLRAAAAGPQAEEPAEHPVLFMVGEGSYHRIYDHCLARWLNDAGVKTEYVEMEAAGLRGNGHMMMLEKNSAEIAKYLGGWLTKNVRPARGESNNRAMPGKNIPTFATDNLARKGFFFAGGKYWGEAGP